MVFVLLLVLRYKSHMKALVFLAIVSSKLVFLVTKKAESCLVVGVAFGGNP